MRSPFLMDGYFDDPDATAEALRDGWYHTGDLGALDDEGYLSIVGRARDVIRSGGETIAPVEVEAVLADASGRSPRSRSSASPTPQWGEVVTAVVVRATATPPPDVDALRSFCEGRLASVQAAPPPRVVDALPRTAATGQVQRTLIVERLHSRTCVESRGPGVPQQLAVE